MQVFHKQSADRQISIARLIRHQRAFFKNLWTALGTHYSAGLWNLCINYHHSWVWQMDGINVVQLSAQVILQQCETMLGEIGNWVEWCIPNFSNDASKNDVRLLDCSAFVFWPFVCYSQLLLWYFLNSGWAWSIIRMKFIFWMKKLWYFLYSFMVL